MSNVVLSGQFYTGGYPDDMRGRSLKVKLDGADLFDANALDMGMSAAQAVLKAEQDNDHGTVLRASDGAMFVPAAGELAKAGIA